MARLPDRRLASEASTSVLEPPLPSTKTGKSVHDAAQGVARSVVDVDELGLQIARCDI